jgi:hypothetical protein
MVSPSGRYRLALEAEREQRDGAELTYLRPVVYDDAGAVVFSSPTRIAGWFASAAAWDEAERAWIASADSGTMVLMPGPDGWRRAVWDPRAPASEIWDAASGERLPVISDTPPADVRRIAR